MEFFLQPGSIFFSEEPFLIHTVLGSCVSVCLWDSRKRFGGMNHYIYAHTDGKQRSAKYGDVSIPYLLRLMLEAGSVKEDLRAHIVGGGQNPVLSPTVGNENIRVAEEFLLRYDIELLSKDTGGRTGRKLIFDNQSGEILVCKGMNVRRGDWYR